MSTDENMHILFYKQAVCKRSIKRKTLYLKMMESQMAITGERDNNFSVQRTEAKEDVCRFLSLSTDTP